MVDDTKDKIRRNLVMFCAVVLISAFLNIRLAEVLNKFLYVSELPIDSTRVTFVSLLILIYLWLRMDRDLTLSKAYENEQKVINNSNRYKANKLVSDILKKWDPKMVPFTYRWVQIRVKYGALEKINDIVMYHNYLHKDIVRIDKRFADWNPHSNLWKGETEVTFQFKFNKEGVISVADHKHSITFAIPLLYIAPKWLRSWLSFLFSETGLEVLFPRILAVLAALVLTLRIIKDLALDNYVAAFAGQLLLP